MRISDWSSDVCSSDLIDEAVANFAVFAERPSSAIEQATAEGEAMRKDLGLQLQATKRREFDSLGIVLGLCYDSRWISQEDGDPPPVEAINYVPNARPGCLADRKSTRLNSSH